MSHSGCLKRDPPDGSRYTMIFYRNVLADRVAMLAARQSFVLLRA
ncbi:hypothetical protein [Erwinia persicina]|nr:hypothetical protein [Erwinia persicina]